MSISAPARAESFPLSQRLFNRRDLVPPQTGVLWRIKRGVVSTLICSKQGTFIGDAIAVAHLSIRLLS